MNKPIYGLKITITRSDLPGVELTIDMPEISEDRVRQQNPALNEVMNNFDAVLGLADH